MRNAVVCHSRNSLAEMKLLLIEYSLLQGSHQDTVSMASFDSQASRIARASFAVAPIIPPLPRGLIRNQNQVLSLFQITKSTPKWRLRSDEPALTTRTPSIHLQRHRIGPPKAGYLRSKSWTRLYP